MNRWTLLFGVGVATTLASLALPWYRIQQCPAMQECGPWQDRTGWYAVGLGTVIVLLVAVGLYVAIKDPLARIVSVSLTFVLLGCFQLFYTFWRIDFDILSNTEGPLAAMFVSLAGLSLAVGAVMWDRQSHSVPTPGP